MAKVINLRAVKKLVARKAARAKGDENAARFGQTKAQRLLERSRAEKADRNLDSHRRETE